MSRKSVKKECQARVSSKSVKQECLPRVSSKRVLSRVPCKTLLLLDDCASHLHKEQTSIFISALVSVHSALHKVTTFGFVGSIRFSICIIWYSIKHGKMLLFPKQLQMLLKTSFLLASETSAWRFASGSEPSKVVGFHWIQKWTSGIKTSGPLFLS